MGSLGFYMAGGRRMDPGTYLAPKRDTHRLPQPLGQHFLSLVQSRLSVQLSTLSMQIEMVLSTGQCARKKRS